MCEALHTYLQEARFQASTSCILEWSANACSKDTSCHIAVSTFLHPSCDEWMNGYCTVRTLSSSIRLRLRGRTYLANSAIMLRKVPVPYSRTVYCMYVRIPMFPSDGDFISDHPMQESINQSRKMIMSDTFDV